MKKIMLITNHSYMLWRFRQELVERLMTEYEVVLVMPFVGHEDDFKALGVRCIEVDVDRRSINPAKDFKLMQTYKKLLKEEAPDLVVTYSIKPNIYGGMACALRKVPYVVNITGLGTAVENSGLVQKITVMLYRLALARVQRVFFQNEENRQFFVDRKLAMGKHGMLPGSGVNLQRFSPLEYPGEETTEFVFISRIMKEKGADQYLEAAEYIREKYPNTRFHICGFCEQAYEQKLKDLHDKGIIIYHGMVRDVKQVIAKTHCTIHPTYYPEGLSNVLLESAACARALITTNRSGCREVIDNGINGFVVEQKNTQDLIEKIEAFLALPWEQKKAMGIAGRAKVEREFDRQIVVEKYLQEMKNL
jgi:galacturonosyltransferase